MHRAFSFPMTAERSRNKERLEASLAGLCELELLKQRQECLVLSALSLGDTVPGHPAWGDLQPPRSAPPGHSRAQDDLTLRRQLNSLQCTPWGLMAALAQLVGDLRVDSESSCTEPYRDMGDSRSSSGFYELSEGQSLLGVSDPSVCGELSPGCAGDPWGTYSGERPKSVGDIFAAKRDGLLEPGPRAGIPRSFSAPYPPLEGIAEGVGEEEPSSWGPGYQEGEPTAEDFHQALRVESYILGLIQRRILAPRPGKPRTTLGPESRGVARQSSLCRREASPNPEGQVWAPRGAEEDRCGGGTLPPEDRLLSVYTPPRGASLDFPRGAPDPSGSEADSPQHFEGRPSPRSPPSDDQLRAPARARAAPRRCRAGEESPTPRKPGRRASRSQSENSLLGQRGAVERKYNTVDRDGGRGGQARPRRPQPGSLGCRRWRSTLELSQDEGEPPGDQASRRPRKSRPAPPPYPHPCPQGALHAYRRVEGPGPAPAFGPHEGHAAPAPGESESSLSDVDSPGSSSLSTDSDESGGLVWPQQLPPQLAPASPPTPTGGPAQPKAFVKIKASHALKKKILRFRTGSLKVMTTV
ncbi:hypothetical protein MATL_G00115950 [Megalops atlanticus]|uniref:Dapper homolog 3 n=1 Tax=Megalops atlanticus TaxID=7932 RepID=A0A9D3TB38_MEGAT|nr:hypothetical protein MATL_G00115950 [Megalops atlanticus]